MKANLTHVQTKIVYTTAKYQMRIRSMDGVNGEKFYKDVARRIPSKVTTYFYKLECGHYANHSSKVQNLKCEKCGH